MAIALFDKFLNTLPITVLEAKDISMVIMIDPPEGLPPSLLAGKGILDTEAKTISVYNSDGSAVAHTFDISTTDLQPIETELAAIKATAEAADTLSKENKQTLNGIDLTKYAELEQDVQFNALTLKSKLVFSNPNGEEIDFTGSLKFNNGGFTKLSILNGSIDVHTQLSMSGTNQIINMASGGDNDTNAANIGDVKRIATEGSGLKPTDDEWDMLNLPVINVGESNETTSAATVGQVNTVSSVANAADTLSKANETRLDNIPTDITPRVEALEANALQKDENGYDAKSFKILNLDSGEDVDSSAANIGDVKRIATEGSGLKPTDNEWDMLNLPVIHVQESAETDSAATVGQVNAVEAKIPNVSNFIETGTTAVLNAVMFGGDTKIDHQDELGLVLQGDSIYGVDKDGYEHFFIEQGNFNVKSKKIQKVRDGTADDDAATVSQVNAVESKADTNASTIANVSGVANAADTLSKDNKTRLDNLPPDVTPRVTTLEENALQKDEYGWDVDNLNVYNVSRLSRTNNAVNSSGLSIGDVDVNLHGDTVGITSSNSATTYAVFTSGGLNLNDYPLTRMGSGGDTDTNAANIGDVKRIATDGSGLKPTDDQWDMLNLPVINVAESEIETSAATVGQVKAVETVANAADTLSKNNATRLDNLPPAPNLDDYAKLEEDVSFHKVSSTGVEFSDDAVIQQATGKKLDLKVGTVVNAELSESGMKLGRDLNASSQNLKNVGDIEHSSNAIILGKSTGNLKVRNVGQITRNNTNEANSVTLGDGTNTYKSNAHNFITNDDEDLVKIDSSGLHFRNTHEDSKGDTTIRVDSGNQNTVYDNIGLVYFNTIDKDSGEKKRIFLTSHNGSVTYDHAVRSKEGFTSGTATFNTNTEGAGFVDLRNSGEVKLGAHNKVEVAIAGKKPLEITSNKLDFSNLAETMTINHGHNIDVSVSGTKNVAFKSNGMKILSNVDGDGHTINHAGDIHFNSGKKIHGNATAGLQVRNLGALYRGDGNGSNIQFDNTNDVRITGDHIRWFHSDGHQYGGISNTGINLRDSTKIVGLPQGSDDTDATNIGHIKELIAEHAPSGGGVEFENYINRTADGSHTFYETTDGNQNAWVSHTNSSKGTITYTFDYSRQGQEVVAGIENRSQRTIIAKLNRRQSTILTVEVPRYSVFTARYIPEIDKYVYNIGSWYPTEQRVLKLSDLNYMSASDPRDVTKNIINAMPKNSIVIARHESGSGSKNTANKNRFISKGDNNSCETEEAIAIIVKYDTDRATGFSTTQGGSGKAWSRVLDGKRHAWFTNDTANNFSLSDDINLDDYPEDQLFLTGDKGMMISSFDEDGNKFLNQVSGYNVPKNEQDIAALEVQTEKNRSQTHYFINEGSLSYDWPDEARRPLVEVQVLNTMQQINNSSVTVTDNDEHIYSGEYNTVGSLAINSLGNWANQYVYHNAYKHVSENYYVVFNQGNLSWQIIQADNPHTSIGEHAASVTVQLGGQSSLPETFGSYTIDPNFENIDSLEFLTAEVPVQYDDVNSRVLINFNGAKPSGYVVLK
tara:strand:+ start:2678 stop:7294 length:4617 start_codon:yes stop_codon:yes gene_type:complete